jgi:hypothetical protein
LQSLVEIQRCGLAVDGETHIKLPPDQVHTRELLIAVVHRNSMASSPVPSWTFLTSPISRSTVIFSIEGAETATLAAARVMPPGPKLLSEDPRVSAL